MTDRANCESDIAIIGMACRLPGANTVSDYWELLCAGESMHRKVPPTKFLQDDRGRLGHAGVTFWGNFLDDPAGFDHQFFNLSSREATSMDPQQRLVLQVAYEAVEAAGYFNESSEARPADVGVYLGVGAVDYQSNVASHPSTAFSALGTLRAFISGRVSHHFGWTGPSLTYDTACSSSAVAVHSACKALISGECSAALAGGVNVITSPMLYEDLSKSGFLSPTGQCKPFDADADGYCRGEGAGILYLKRLSAALACDDPILGIIASSAVIQSDNSTPITVPHVFSQTKLYRTVLEHANLKPAQVGVVEAHGTGTPVGDPIEFESIQQVFGSERRDKLFVTSVKGNIGHTEAVSGVASAIKAVMMMQNATVPKQANFTSLNPRIIRHLEDQVDIPRQTQPWHGTSVLVNNYGAAGSNAAFVICKPPAYLLPDSVALRNKGQLKAFPCIITAHTEASLRLYCAALCTSLISGSLSKLDGMTLPDAAFAMAHRANHSFPFSFTAISNSLFELTVALANPQPQVRDALTKKHAKRSPTDDISGTGKQAKPTVLCFGGQNRRLVGLHRDVYNSCIILRKYLDSCESICTLLGPQGFYPQIFSQDAIEDVVLLHCIIFSVQYACAKAWMDCGLRVDTLMGHSFGFLTALCVSDVLSLQEALQLVIDRATLIRDCWGPEKGVMLSVEAGYGQISELLAQISNSRPADSVEIACFNSPTAHILVGSAPSIAAVEDAIASGRLYGSIRHHRLDVTHGFHSYLMDPILPAFARAVNGLNFRKPRIHIEICTESQVLTVDAEAVAQHSRKPVYFSHAVNRIASNGPCTWIEAGTESNVTMMARSALAQRTGHTFHSVSLTSTASMSLLADATVEMWRSGVQVQFWPYHRTQKQQYRKLDLPPYQFAQTNHWLTFLENTELPLQKPRVTQHPAMLSLLSFVRPQNGQQSLAEFQVDPANLDFKAYVDGHKVLGHSSCPASVYLCLATQALIQLVDQENPAFSRGHKYCIQSMVMPSPLQIDHKRTIVVKMETKEESPNHWSFQVISRDLIDTSSVMIHARGVTTLESSKADRATEGHRHIIPPDKYQAEHSIGGVFIYSVFSAIVDYADIFRGVKSISFDDPRVLGRVQLPESRDVSTFRSSADPLLVDSILQVAGLYINCLRHKESEDVFVCSRIESFHYPYQETNLRGIAYDVVVHIQHEENGTVFCEIVACPSLNLDASIKLTGVQFSGISKDALARTLSKRQHDPTGLLTTSGMNSMPDTSKISVAKSANVVDLSAELSPTSLSVDSKLKNCLSDVTGVPLHDIHESSALEEIGVDSLMTVDVLDEIEKAFNVNIPMNEFQELKDFKSLALRIKSRVPSELGVADDNFTSSELDDRSDSNAKAFDEERLQRQLEFVQNGPTPSAPWILMIGDSIKATEAELIRFLRETQLEGFTRNVLPQQKSLVIEYITKAFDNLRYSVSNSKRDECKSDMILPKYAKLTAHLSHILEKASDPQTIETEDIRLATRDNHASRRDSLSKLCTDFPQHQAELQLLHIVGSRLGECLSGAEDPLHLLFGTNSNRDLLTDVYTNAPVFATGTRLLSTFLSHQLTSTTHAEPIRIMEIGGGVGGTTLSIIQLLKDIKCPFIYTFTDISASLVAAARKKLAYYDSVNFMVLDVESLPEASTLESQDIIISTNTIHATKNLANSCAHIRQMLAKDGVLCLVELGRQLVWYDLVFGLLDGWWRFDDDRAHALADAYIWERSLHEAGFENVQWTDSDHAESDLIRLIVASASDPTVKTSTVHSERTAVTMETVIFTQVEGLPLYADIYYPTAVKPCPAKQPVALLIHGGGHVMLSRKDIRPSQTQHLLDNGITPISIDHRLCPELDLIEGPMTDLCSALAWARNDLSGLKLQRPDIQVDSTRIAVVGWSTGGMLAMSLGWTAPARGLKPPEAILAFYCPTDYGSEWYREPHFPWRTSQADAEKSYDLWEAVRDRAITGYNISSTRSPGGWMSTQDLRARIPLHMNWTGQTIPILLGALSSKAKEQRKESSEASHSTLEPHDGRTRLRMPPASRIEAINPLAQIRAGNYRTPTYLVHGTEDDFISWQETQRTYDELIKRGIPAGISIVAGGGHMFEMLGIPKNDGRVWQAVLDGYQFVFERLRDEPRVSREQRGASTD